MESFCPLLPCLVTVVGGGGGEMVHYSLLPHHISTRGKDSSLMSFQGPGWEDSCVLKVFLEWSRLLRDGGFSVQELRNCFLGLLVVHIYLRISTGLGTCRRTWPVVLFILPPSFFLMKYLRSFIESEELAPLSFTCIWKCCSSLHMNRQQSWPSKKAILKIEHYAINVPSCVNLGSNSFWHFVLKRSFSFLENWHDC